MFMKSVAHLEKFILIQKNKTLQKSMRIEKATWENARIDLHRRCLEVSKIKQHEGLYSATFEILPI